tara:strand:+ start:9772 stop:10131 length:360 start_codon:yes stop_codon:yes gene_type:complete
MGNKSQTGLIGFIYKNKITLLLIVILFALVKQNIIDNNFPKVVIDKEHALNQIKMNNENLENDNVALQNKIGSYTQEDLNLIESKARFKYGLVKEGEIFFKINKTIETEPLTENVDATL